MKLARVLIFLVVLVVPTGVFGQTATGRLAGVVLDATGASIPGASVTVRSESTGVTVELETSVAGSFNVGTLVPGMYTIEVSAEGFRNYTVNHQKVDVALATSLGTDLDLIQTGQSPVLLTREHHRNLAAADRS